MADIGNILDGPDTGGVTFYDPSQDKPSVPMPEGQYPAHVIEVKTATRDVKGKYKALIFNIRVRIAPKSDSHREMRSNGIFKFLHPSDDDEFESNPGGNKGYSNFCVCVGKEPQTKEIEMNGEMVSVKELPDLKEEDIMGKPVMAVIGRGKPWKSDRDGKVRTSLEVKWFRTWADGEAIDVDDAKDDDLPF